MQQCQTIELPILLSNFNLILSFGIGSAFKTAYHGGCVLGFVLVSFSLMVLMSLILTYKAIALRLDSTIDEYRIIFETIAGYGLGGSSVALFCRVGGGIYTKAADVGADLVSKVNNFF